MLLAAIDAGNTRVHAALFAPMPTGVVLVDHRDDPDFRKWRVPVAEVVYTSVRPELDRRLERAVKAGWNLRARKMGRLPARSATAPGSRPTGAAGWPTAWPRGALPGGVRRGDWAWRSPSTSSMRAATSSGARSRWLAADGAGAPRRHEPHRLFLPVRARTSAAHENRVEAGLYAAAAASSASAGISWGAGAPVRHGRRELVRPCSTTSCRTSLEGIALSWLQSLGRLR
jgi:hypothetical protein